MKHANRIIIFIAVAALMFSGIVSEQQAGAQEQILQQKQETQQEQQSSQQDAEQTIQQVPEAEQTETAEAAKTEPNETAEAVKPEETGEKPIEVMEVSISEIPQGIEAQMNQDRQIRLREAEEQLTHLREMTHKAEEIVADLRRETGLPDKPMMIEPEPPSPQPQEMQRPEFGLENVMNMGNEIRDLFIAHLERTEMLVNSRQKLIEQMERKIQMLREENNLLRTHLRERDEINRDLEQEIRRRIEIQEQKEAAIENQMRRRLASPNQENEFQETVKAQEVEKPQEVEKAQDVEKAEETKETEAKPKKEAPAVANEG